MAKDIDMTAPSVSPLRSRRRIWIAAGSVSGIIAATTMVAAVGLGGQEPRKTRNTGISGKAAAPRITLPKVDWKLSWRDEFNGRGKPSAAWTALTGNGVRGWGHQARQYYVPEASRQNGRGQLVIAARKTPASSKLKCWNGRCGYTSGRIQTIGKFEQRYGRFAVRAKLPTGSGMWPAFWMQKRGKPYGEIDVVEISGKYPKLVQGFAHANRRVGAGHLKLRKPVSAEYHTYGVDWTPWRIVWWMDGKPYAQMKAYKGWPFDKPFYLILNLQVGNNWPGKPDRTTRFPAYMSVDWVRVYRA
ncbi:hypothetical protein GCM10009678_29380 [Actinomadura kijaniata]